MAATGLPYLTMAVQQIPDGSWVSPDGRWLWRGGRWMPMPAAERTGIFWFISAPDWARTVALMGLIGLIPFVGSMNIYGYAIVTARNIRAGHRVLPPANFSYIALGAPVFVLTVAWLLVVYLAMAAVGTAVGFGTYAQSHSVAWAIGLGVASGFTALGVLNFPTLPLLVPALEMSEREGWGVFHIGRLIRHATGHWRATWYGVAIFVLWYLMYFALALVLSPIPFGSLLVAIAGFPAMALMLAIPIARFDDPPATFGKGHANALAVGLAALAILVLAVPWGIAIVAASYVSDHPDEVACFITPGCTVSTTNNLEALVTTTRSPKDPTLLTVDVTFINRSASAASIDPADYYARPTAGIDLLPSSDCSAPSAAGVDPGKRLTQHACFRLPNADVGFDVHVPWIGWVYGAP
jgi:hypothetical protein